MQSLSGVVVVVILNLIVLSQCAVKDDEGKLIFAHVVSSRILGFANWKFISIFFLQIFRHGDRTPVEPYPTDPWKDAKWWETGFGQLTNVSLGLAFLSSPNSCENQQSGTLKEQKR